MMLFRLHGAAATFQRLVDNILNHCEGFTLAYLDDIIIHSRTWEEHLTHLGQVFRLLQAAGHKVNPRKSKLRCREIEVLRYTVGKGCMKPQKKGGSYPTGHPTSDQEASATIPRACGVLQPLYPRLRHKSVTSDGPVQKETAG